MRTFVAAEISDEKVLNSIAKLQSEIKIKAKPVSKQNMHFTLLFLGEISDEMAKKVMESLSTVSFSPIEV
ncbi:MAG: RNA 2',3'-cyclic phosphodiesterase, partial [Thaumarchaeota archaeon]|nr:RNA 2',3'-cyclic phosphodiesterase [Nitrososphaerota archaeon]